MKYLITVVLLILSFAANATLHFYDMYEPWTFFQIWAEMSDDDLREKGYYATFSIHEGPDKGRGTSHDTRCDLVVDGDDCWIQYRRYDNVNNRHIFDGRWKAKIAVLSPWEFKIESIADEACSRCDDPRLVLTCRWYEKPTKDAYGNVISKQNGYGYMKSVRKNGEVLHMRTRTQRWTPKCRGYDAVSKLILKDADNDAWMTKVWPKGEPEPLMGLQ